MCERRRAPVRWRWREWEECAADWRWVAVTWIFYIILYTSRLSVSDREAQDRGPVAADKAAQTRDPTLAYRATSSTDRGDPHLCHLPLSPPHIFISSLTVLRNSNQCLPQPMETYLFGRAQSLNPIQTACRLLDLEVPRNNASEGSQPIGIPYSCNY
ncbi:hypothetical protein J6590_011289 [Homalodisca vitripennis]|nr:hypothetical protein J6590_011289 [Homalodisca vitripennis]